MCSYISVRKVGCHEFNLAQLENKTGIKAKDNCHLHYARKPHSDY